MDFQKFYQGAEFEAYKYLGAHMEDGEAVFRVFAPSALHIEVIGDFNNWNGSELKRIYDGNFWEYRIRDASYGMKYKFRIYGKDGSVMDHADPFAFYSEKRPDTASIIYPISSYVFSDQKWMEERTTCFDRPMNIYELHFGSWRRSGEDPDGFCSYRELADMLIQYVKEHGYNYIEPLPLSEHPNDLSWGYQGTGYFSPTSRYGNPDDFRYLIDTCHQNGIGVIMDFVPVHFAIDGYALRNFDGTHLYEYPDDSVGVSEWGSCNFMHSRGEVRSFLSSSALYWLKEFHIDGLRMDAVSNLIYWQGDSRRGCNEGAIRFLRDMNKGLKERVPDSILIAEDSTTYPGVTKEVAQGGLGFDYKWDLGWMNDTFSFFRLSDDEKIRNMTKLSFSMMYFNNERYMLPFSHDEVVNGKGSLLSRVNGNMAMLKVLFLYMIAHPGKKLSFMGNEIASLSEWNAKEELDWNLLNDKEHLHFSCFISDLNMLYLSHPALWEDYDKNAFRWIETGDDNPGIIAFERITDNEKLVFIFNLLESRNAMFICHGKFDEAVPLLFSEWQEYGGTEPDGTFRCNRSDDSIMVQMKPASALCLLIG